MSVEFGDVFPLVLKGAEVALDGVGALFNAFRVAPEQRRALLAPLLAKLNATADAVEAAPVFDPDAVPEAKPTVPDPTAAKPTPP